MGNANCADVRQNSANVCGKCFSSSISLTNETHCISNGLERKKNYLYAIITMHFMYDMNLITRQIMI